MKIVEYTIFSAPSPVALLKVVRKAMTEGWQPFGGMVTQGHFNDFFQTMVKYET